MWSSPLHPRPRTLKVIFSLRLNSTLAAATLEPSSPATLRTSLDQPRLRDTPQPGQRCSEATFTLGLLRSLSLALRGTKAILKGLPCPQSLRLLFLFDFSPAWTHRAHGWLPTPVQGLPPAGCESLTAHWGVRVNQRPYPA